MSGQMFLRFQRERVARCWRAPRPLLAYDQQICDEVIRAGEDAEAMSTALLRYFWTGYAHSIDRHGTIADYPGAPSCYGARNDAIEGVTRLLPLWAAAYSSPLCANELRAPMGEALVRALTHGCDPGHPGYWGSIGPRSTLICEAADVALAVWLSRETLWPALELKSRRQVLGWLESAIDQPTADNNWHLFSMVCDAVCRALGDGRDWRSEGRMARIASFATTNGCFRDGPVGQVDLYNAWGFHYLLFWLRKILPERIQDRWIDHLADYVEWYRWLITPQGMPLWGRSLCYRLATPLPLQMAALDGRVGMAEARAAYFHIWRYFVGEGALRAGRPTQGVFGEDVRLLDPYSGPASSFWGARSLLMHLHFKELHEAELGALPSILSSTSCLVGGLGASLSAGDGRSEIVFSGDESFMGWLTPTRRERLRGYVYGLGVRPANNPLKRGIKRFSSTLEIYR